MSTDMKQLVVLRVCATPWITCFFIALVWRSCIPMCLYKLQMRREAERHDLIFAVFSYYLLQAVMVKNIVKHCKKCCRGTQILIMFSRLRSGTAATVMSGRTRTAQATMSEGQNFVAACSSADFAFFATVPQELHCQPITRVLISHQVQKH